MPQGITQGSWRVTLAGVDITNYCQESSFTCQDTLGQGPGVAAGSSGRAKKATIRTSLGPASSAIGAGQAVPILNMLSPNQSNVETDLTGLTARNGAVISRATSVQWEGAASVKAVTDGTQAAQGVFAGLPSSSFAPGMAYTVSAYILAPVGAHINISLYQDTPAQTVGTFVTITGTGGWQRVTQTATTPNVLPSGNIGINLRTNGSLATTFWVDALQVESGSTMSAWGIGQSLRPTLVRQGEIKVYDTTGTCIYGGYASDIIDQIGISESGRSVIYSDINATDYWQDWDRINIVSEVFDGQTDFYVIRYLINKYAPGVDYSSVPSTGGFTLGPLNFKNMSLQKAVQSVADKTGYACWITPDTVFKYAAPGGFATAPFALSTTPDFISSYQMGFTSYEQDDTSAINRVTFYGGKQLSGDYTQDLSPLCNGNADTIPLAYYPHKSSDGLYHVHVGGVSKTVGFYGSTGAANTLIKNGGSADVLINIDAHTLIFNTAPSNTGINSVTCTYRFEAPLVVQIVDNASVAFYGRYLDGTISDTSIFDTQTAAVRCRTLLNEQSFGLATLKVKCWTAGIQSGMLLRVDHDSRNIHETFLVQEVDIQPLGGGAFEYQITAGAWHWNLVDFVMTTALNASVSDASSDESAVATQIQDMNESVNVAEAWTKTTRATHNLVWGTSKFRLTSF